MQPQFIRLFVLIIFWLTKYLCLWAAQQTTTILHFQQKSAKLSWRKNITAIELRFYRYWKILKYIDLLLSKIKVNINPVKIFEKYFNICAWKMEKLIHQKVLEKKRLAMYFTDIPRELGNLTAILRVVCHRPHKLLRN